MEKKTPLTVSYRDGKITVNFKNAQNRPYSWSSKNRTLRSGKTVVKTGLRMSNLFTRSNRRRIKSVVKNLEKNEPNVRTRPQQGGTCWFHGIINGLLMSPRSRKILEQRIPPASANTSVTANTNTCPSRSASSRYFWNYIRHRLSGRGRVNARYVNKNVIKNLGLRKRGVFPNFSAMIPRPTNTRRTYTKRFLGSLPFVHGGAFSDLHTVYDKLFPGDWSMYSKNRPTTFVVKKEPETFHEIISHAGHLYNLSHSFIQAYIPGIAGHVMAGYVSRAGNYVIFDSGYGIVLPIDWHVKSGNEEIIEYVRHYYRFPVTRMSKWGVYVKSNPV